MNEQQAGTNGHREEAAAKLLDAVVRAAADRGFNLGRAKAFRDRFGPVDVMQFTVPGYICANRSANGAIDLAVWRFGDLVAWGQTADPGVVAEVMHLWNGGASAGDLATAVPGLHLADDNDWAPEIQATWRWLLDYGDDYLQPLAQAAYAEPTLRSLFPFVSHGSLGLIDGRVRHQTYQATFYRKSGNDEWLVGFHHAIDPDDPDRIRHHTVDAPDLAQAVAVAVADVSDVSEQR